MSNISRVKRLETSIHGRGKVDPERVKGALAFLRSGDESAIPVGVMFADVKAAARMIEAGKAGKARGLAKIGAALGDKGGGDVLTYIGRMTQAKANKDFRVFWPEDKRPGFSNKPTEADRLLSRLGFCRIINIVYQAADIYRKITLNEPEVRPILKKARQELIDEGFVVEEKGSGHTKA